MTPSATPDEYYCLNPHCLVGSWSVTREQEQVWRITATFDNYPFLVAATTPHCPCCGAQLQTPLEMEGGMGVALDDEQGPLFDFVRSLR